MINNIIEIQNLSKSYRNNNNEQVQVFKDFSTQFEKHKIHCLLGVSGSGKSSLLKLISGLESPDEGNIVFDENKVKDSFAMIFQENNLFPWLTVYKNIYLVLKSYYKSKKIKIDKKSIQNQIEKELEKYQLLQYKDFYPYELSGGLNQKVTLVKTLITNPSLILFDESFSALDYLSKELMHEFLISEFEKNNCTAILTTHDVREAVKLGDYIHIISRNSYVKIENILKKPREENTEFEQFCSVIKNHYRKGEN